MMIRKKLDATSSKARLKWSTRINQLIKLSIHLYVSKDQSRANLTSKLYQSEVLQIVITFLQD